MHGDRARSPSVSVRGDQHVDREVLRCPAFGRRAAHDLSERRAELLLHEALEGLARLPDVVDVVALLALAGAVDDQPLRRLVFPHGGGVPKHLLCDVVVDLLRELGRCRQDSNRHLASSSLRGRRILWPEYAESTLVRARFVDNRARSKRFGESAKKGMPHPPSRAFPCSWWS